MNQPVTHGGRAVAVSVLGDCDPGFDPRREQEKKKKFAIPLSYDVHAHLNGLIRGKKNFSDSSHREGRESE